MKIKNILFLLLIFTTLFIASILVINYDIIRQKITGNSIASNIYNEFPKYKQLDKKPSFYMLTDKNNNPVTKETFEKMLKTSDDFYIVVRQDHKYGLIDINGKRILPSIYRNIITSGFGKYIKASTFDNKEFLFDEKGKTVLSGQRITKRNDYYIVRHNLVDCTLYSLSFKKILSYKDEHETRIITKNLTDYLVTRVNNNTITIDLNGKKYTGI